MTSKELKILREKIAGLSSGVYYDSIFRFFSTLDGLLLSNYCHLTCGSDYPQVYNDSGRLNVDFTKGFCGEESYRVFVSYYRMPSGRWEIVCYLT